jgi:hypothetical protein
VPLDEWRLKRVRQPGFTALLRLDAARRLPL